MSSQTEEKLIEAVRLLQEENKLLKKQIKELQKENALLKQELAEVRSELRKYRNENTPSGMTPSYLKEETNNRHKKSGQKEGHEGISREAPEKIDRTEELTLEKSPCCNSKVRKINAKLKRRIVIVINKPEIEHVEYLKHRYICGKCGKEVQPEVPNALPNSRFDLSFMILLSSLSVGLNLPYGKIRELLKILFNLEVSEATISNNISKLSGFLGPEYEKLKEEIRKAPVRYNDETGWRILGKGSWLWAFISDKAAFYTIERSRGRKVVKKILGKRSKGVNVTDGLKSYEEHESRKQKCWSHILRRFRMDIFFPFKSDKERDDFRKLRNNLRLLYKRAKEAKEREGVSVKLREKYEYKLKRILKKEYKGKNSEKILTTVRNQQDELFTFLEFKDVEPTNNRVERALRHAVVKRKISGQNRSMEHANNYCMQLSFYQTAKLKGENYSDMIRNIITS